MRKYYTSPEMEIRKYRLTSESITTSDPGNNGNNDLFDDDNVDYFG